MTNFYEAEVIIGIEDIAIEELKNLEEIDIKSIKIIRSGFIRFRYEGDIQHLHELRSIVAIYAIYHFDIPRPKAILGHKNFTKLISILNQYIYNWKSKPDSFGIGAAGSDSSVFQRIKLEISKSLSLNISDDNKGELFIRFIPAKKQSGWEILVRILNHPIAKRSWRIKNIPGALNATVAYAMIRLGNPQNHHRIINLCSGTATILIEQANQNITSPLIALDNSQVMIQDASINIMASDPNNIIIPILGNAQQTPFNSDTFDIIYADLPFGHYIGSHDTNEWLYPAILSESARIATHGAKFIVATHEINLFMQSLQSSSWQIKHNRQINLSGLHPQIFVLERK